MAIVAAVDTDEEDLALFGDFDWWEQGSFRGWALEQPYPENIPAALAALKTAFPPDVCRKIVKRGDALTIMPLFMVGIQEYSRTNLLLGRDLAIVPPGAARAELIQRLGELDKFWGAQFELAVWSLLIRAGLATQHGSELEPTLRRPGGSKVRCADFLVTDGGYKVAIDTKSLLTPDADRNIAALEEQIGLIVGRWQRHVGGQFDVWLVLDDRGEHLVTDFKARKFQQEVLARFAASIEQVAQSQESSGSTPLGKLCRGVPRTGSNRYGVRDWSGRSLPDKARRLINTACRAREQLTRLDADLRALVMATSTEQLTARAPAESELCQAAEEKRTALDGIDTIFVVNRHRQLNGWNTDVLALHLTRKSAAICARLVLPQALRAYQFTF